jgi:hypothetical protein
LDHAYHTFGDIKGALDKEDNYTLITTRASIGATIYVDLETENKNYEVYLSAMEG